MSDLGNAASPNLECITSKLGTVLRIYETFLGSNIRFGSYPQLHQLPNKNYTARTIVPIQNNGMKIGDLYVILFKPGDGTGNEDYFTKEELIIPNELTFRDKPERVFPRYKEGILVEAFFPFFSVYNDALYFNSVSLEELTLQNSDETKSVARLGHLGLNPDDYKKTLRNGIQTSIHPFIQMTIGYTRAGERFGDPYAVYCSKDIVALQVAGFLAITDKENPLAKIIDKLARNSF